MAKGKQSDKNKFQGYFPEPHGTYYRTSPREREQKAAELRAQRQAKQERFRRSLEKGRWFLSKTKVLTHWLKQIEIAASGPKKYWGDTKGDTKYDWPKDKAIIYAVMAICIEKDSAIRIIPNSLRQTECYKVNKHVSTWVEVFDLSVEFMDYIEADLENEGLLPSKSESIDNSTKPQVHMVQAESDSKPKRNIKKRFTVNSGQAQFDGKDLCIPTGLACDVLKKLVTQFGVVVKYKDLDDNSSDKEASEQLRNVKRVIVKSFEVNKVPCAIESKTRYGYVIKKTTKRSSKTHHK